MTAIAPFHLAFPVDDLVAAKEFYGGIMGLAEGRSSDTWIDYNLFGHIDFKRLKCNDFKSLIAGILCSHIECVRETTPWINRHHLCTILQP